MYNFPDLRPRAKATVAVVTRVACFMKKYHRNRRTFAFTGRDSWIG